MKSNLKYDEKKLISRAEAAKMLGVSVQTITNYINRGMIHGTKCGTHTYVFRESIEKSLKEYGNVKEIEQEISNLKTEYEKEIQKFRDLSDETMKDIGLLERAYRNNQ